MSTAVHQSFHLGFAAQLDIAIRKAYSLSAVGQYEITLRWLCHNREAESADINCPAAAPGEVQTLGTHRPPLLVGPLEQESLGDLPTRHCPFTHAYASGTHHRAPGRWLRQRSGGCVTVSNAGAGGAD